MRRVGVLMAYGEKDPFTQAGVTAVVQALARFGWVEGKNVWIDAPIMGKWLQLLKEVAPSVTRVTVIVNPDTAPYGALFMVPLRPPPQPLGVTVTAAEVHDDGGIEEAIVMEAREPGGGLIILPDSFNVTHRDAIIAAATRHGLPLIGLDTFPSAGGLMSYTTDTVDLHAQAASYIDRILKGANPADLPVQQPTKFSLIINLKTAKALGLAFRQACSTSRMR